MQPNADTRLFWCTDPGNRRFGCFWNPANRARGPKHTPSRFLIASITALSAGYPWIEIGMRQSIFSDWDYNLSESKPLKPAPFKGWE